MEDINFDDIKNDTKEIENKEKLPTQNLEVDSQITKLSNNLFDNTVDKKEFSNTLGKIGLLQALKSNRNIKRNEKIQKNEYFSEQETLSKINKSENNTQAGIAFEKEQIVYFNNHKDVLTLMRMNTPHSLYHMKFVYWIGVFPYFLLELMHCAIEIAGSIIGLVDVFFKSAFGKTELQGTDTNGKPIYAKGNKLNLVTRILLMFFIAMFGLYLLFAFINAFTGFDLIEMLKSYTKKIINN
ncbi:MAG: hypothetical protein RR454_03135 [Clostridia bacterium]